ncbi:rifin [Plasmodium sp. gorilla clade G1]|nr:rifin [Plasmodium sp. gorilla clade G1]
MKFNSPNILLFSLSLNILLLSSEVHNQGNHYITHHIPIKKPIKSHRSLCECELYMSNYDNDPEMKAVIQDFDRQASERFEEYNKRMIKNRKKCKEQCEKDIQKIILKDKIEKELAEKFMTLETNIDTSDIPTCVCENSLADKTEKFCLNCGYGLGGALTSWEILGYIEIYGWNIFATSVAKEIGTKEGIKVAIEVIKKLFDLGSRNIKFENLVTAKNYGNMNLIGEAVKGLPNTICKIECFEDVMFCDYAINEQSKFALGVKTYSKNAAEAGATEFSRVMSEKTLQISTTTGNFSNVMIASGITILVIVLIMVIIYLILRYRRKKKMKKKLQYIKLLKE